MVILTTEAISELNYWSANALALNSRPFVYPVNILHYIVHYNASEGVCASHTIFNRLQVNLLLTKSHPKKSHLTHT